MVEALCTADAAYGVIADIHQLAANGREKDALHMLGFLADAVAAHRPVLRGVINAQVQAAEMRDASERTTSTIAKIIRRPAHEELNPANDIAQSPSPTPSQPAA